MIHTDHETAKKRIKQNRSFIQVNLMLPTLPGDPTGELTRQAVSMSGHDSHCAASGEGVPSCSLACGGDLQTIITMPYSQLLATYSITPSSKLLTTSVSNGLLSSDGCMVEALHALEMRNIGIAGTGIRPLTSMAFFDSRLVLLPLPHPQLLVCPCCCWPLCPCCCWPRRCWESPSATHAPLQ